MKKYVKPMIAEAELFTQDAIAVSIPKTRYNVGTSERQLVAYTLGGSEDMSALVGSKYSRK